MDKDINGIDYLNPNRAGNTSEEDEDENQDSKTQLVGKEKIIDYQAIADRWSEMMQKCNI